MTTSRLTTDNVNKAHPNADSHHGSAALHNGRRIEVTQAAPKTKITDPLDRSAAGPSHGITQSPYERITREEYLQKLKYKLQAMERAKKTLKKLKSGDIEESSFRNDINSGLAGKTTTLEVQALIEATKQLDIDIRKSNLNHSEAESILIRLESEIKTTEERIKIREKELKKYPSKNEPSSKNAAPQASSSAEAHNPSTPSDMEVLQNLEKDLKRALGKNRNLLKRKFSNLINHRIRGKTAGRPLESFNQRISYNKSYRKAVADSLDMALHVSTGYWFNQMKSTHLSSENDNKHIAPQAFTSSPLYKVIGELRSTNQQRTYYTRQEVKEILKEVANAIKKLDKGTKKEIRAAQK